MRIALVKILPLPALVTTWLSLSLINVDAFLPSHDSSLVSRARRSALSHDLPIVALESFSIQRSNHESSQIDDKGRLSRRGFLVSVAASVVVLDSVLSSPPAASAADAVSSPATCDATVSVWRRDNRLIYLLGTAHISEKSAELADQLVKETHPSAVFVELDLRRVAGGSTVGVGKDGIVSTQLGVDPGASPRSRVVIPQVIPVSERDGTGDIALTSTATAVSAQNADRSALTASSSSSASTAPAKPSWFRRTLTDWGAALVGKAIRALYSNLGDAGFSPGEEFVVAINQGQALGRYVTKSILTLTR